MRKLKVKWKRSLNKLKKLGIGTRALNFSMFIIGWVVVVFLAVMYIKSFGIKTVVPDDSMLPTFESDQVLNINRLVYKISSPKRLDTVVVQVGQLKSNVFLVSRIVGLPGEKIQIKDGNVYIDEKKIDYPKDDGQIENAGIAKDMILLGEDEYFLICDNYNNSNYDSRSSNIGVINKSQIEGRVK